MTSDLKATTTTTLTVMTKAAAMVLTDRIRTTVEDFKTTVLPMIVEAYSGQVWIALGSPSWDDWCDEWIAARFPIPADDRDEVILALRGAGMSLRAITAATTIPKRTVSDVAARVRIRTREPDDEVVVDAEVVDETPAGPAQITGRDGKRYNLSDPSREADAPGVDDVGAEGVVFDLADAREQWKADIDTVLNDPPKVYRDAVESSGTDPTMGCGEGGKAQTSASTPASSQPRGLWTASTPESCSLHSHS